MTNNADFTLAAVQAAPHFFDRQASCEKACRLIQEAADKGANLAAFGETWIAGYPWWAGLGGPGQSPAGSQQLPVVRKARLAYLENAVEIPSPTTDRLCQAAGDAGIDVSIGVTERELHTHATTYCTMLFIGKEGRILGRHRKLKPSGHERTVWGEGDGSSLRVYRRDYGAIGGLNCWEHRMLLPAYTLIAQGLQIHVAAWPFGSGGTLSKSIALQGNCYVIAVGAAYRRENLPDSLIELHYPQFEEKGGSCIIDPAGSVVAQAEGNEETIVLASGSLEEIADLKLWCDIGGHYSRPDVFRLSVNRRPLKRVSLLDSTDRDQISSDTQGAEADGHEFDEDSANTL